MQSGGPASFRVDRSDDGGGLRKSEVVVRAPVMGIQRGDDDLREANGR
jgi:hypothetical protein